MTFRNEIPVALDRAHAGDLVGFDKWGRAMRLPGGGARDGAIVAGPDDDDADDPDDDEPDDSPAPGRGRKPTYKDLLEQNASLSAQLDPETRRRMNAENRRLRGVRQFAEKHNIGDLNAWLDGIGIDPETGKPKAVAPDEEPAPAKPAKKTAKPVEPDPGEELEDEPEDEAESDDFAGISQAEFNRRVELEVEKRMAEADESDPQREELLMQVIQTTSVQAELAAAGFTGSIVKAMRVLDMDTIVVDADGTVIGADEAVASLKEEIPEWFRRAPGRTPPREVGGEAVDGGGKPPRKPAEADWAARAVSALVKGRS